MEQKNGKDITGILKWGIEPLVDLVVEIKQYGKHLGMVSTAISILASDEVGQIVANQIEKTSIFKHLEIQKYIAAAKDEKESYRHLIEQALISNFAYLEAGIKHLITSIFIHEPTRFNQDEVGKLNIGLLEYHTKSEQELADYFFAEYEKKFGRTSYGVVRFEQLLKPAGLSGPVDKETESAIFEQAQIRNLLLHKGGIVDRHFLDKCGNLNYSLGDRIMVTIEQMGNYIEADVKYVRIVLNRVISIILQPLGLKSNNSEQQNEQNPLTNFS